MITTRELEGIGLARSDRAVVAVIGAILAAGLVAVLGLVVRLAVLLFRR